MFRFQRSLPRLPVPTLSSTASRYLESAQPHLSASAFARTQAAVNAFLQSPQAAELQSRLNARAADPDITNWLADWWNDNAYMGYRDPVVAFVRSAAFLCLNMERLINSWIAISSCMQMTNLDAIQQRRPLH
jgi:carnitine O-acetyltransferase